MEIYIIKKFVSKLVNDFYRFLKKLVRNMKSIFKFILFVFVALFIYYLVSRGA